MEKGRARRPGAGFARRLKRHRARSGRHLYRAALRGGEGPGTVPEPGVIRAARRTRPAPAARRQQEVGP